jgi:protein-disulfide isomerase
MGVFPARPVAERSSSAWIDKLRPESASRAPVSATRAHFGSMARIPKTRKSKPEPARRPSGLVVVLAFAVAVGAAVALVAAALALRGDDSAAPPSPTSAVDLDGIPQEGTVLGSPEARVTLIEYADLQCPACRAYNEGMFPSLVRDYVRPGKVKTEFRGLAFIGPDSARALRLVLAAGLQDRLWHLQEALYRNQGGENSGWVTDELVRELGAEIDGLDVERLFTDADSEEVEAMAAEAAEQANAAEVGGTPTLNVQIGDAEPYPIQVGLDTAQLAAALDDALAR